MKVPIPDAAFAQHTIALGKTRAGKSSKLRVLIERLLDGGKPICLIDPKGDWWGLKSSADGKSPGYPVVIFGGERADVPIAEHSGAAVAELVAGGNRPCVIDLGGWMVGQRTRFFIDFASTLFRLTRGERWLAIDECHNFAPKGAATARDPQMAMMLHWANRLASEGAGKGLILLSASQRPQKVHNDYLTSHETLIACRVIHKADRDAFKDWIDGCADPAIGREVLGALANIERSQAYVWSPEIKFGPKLIDWPMFATYDSFRPQGARASAPLAGWASVDLEEVKAKLAVAVAEARANDPRALREEIATLKRELAKKPDGAGDAALRAEIARLGQAVAQQRQEAEDERRRGWREGYAVAMKDAWRGFGETLADMEAAAGLLRANLAALDEQLRTGAAIAATPPVAPLMPEAKADVEAMRHGFAAFAPIRVPNNSPVITGSKSDPARAGAADEAALTGPQQRILATLARVLPAGMTEAQWAIAAGMKRSGGAWGAHKSNLRAAGAIALDGGLWRATESGRAALGETPPALPQPGPELVEFWAERIQAAAPMLRLLAKRYPERLTRDEIAAALDMTASGGAFGAHLSRLRAAGLIEERRGEGLRAAPALMEGA